MQARLRRHAYRDAMRRLSAGDRAADVRAVRAAIVRRVRCDPAAQRIDDDKIGDATLERRMLRVDAGVQYGDVDPCALRRLPQFGNIKLSQSPRQAVTLL